MGYAVAEAASRRGAHVTLVSGPTALPAPAVADLVSVKSALEMEAAVADRAGKCDAIVMTAAVADFRPAKASKNKLKKKAAQNEYSIDLVRNPDILAGLGQRFKGAGRPILIGFALETENLQKHAKAKLKAKGIQIIVANLAEHAFGGDDNEAIIVDDKGSVKKTGRLSKRQLSELLLDILSERLCNSSESIP
jgi:phosphopantothenoylcysteine decarboxylase/phosphopantothenate--cysteine ligase